MQACRDAEAGQRYVARYHEGPVDGTTDVWTATEDGPKQHVGVQIGLKRAWYVYIGFSAGVASQMKHLYQYESHGVAPTFL